MADVKLSSLRVYAEMDVQQYVRAAAQKSEADAKMAASSSEVGRALAAVDAASGSAAAKVTQISRMWLDGYASAAKFEKAVRDIGNALDKGMDVGRAAAALDGVYRKFGQTADAAVLAKTGFVSLAPIVSALNQQYEAVAVSAARAAAAQKEAAVAANFQSGLNSRLGVNRPAYDAAFSAGNMAAELQRIETAEAAFVDKSLRRWSEVAQARRAASEAWNDEIAAMRRAEAGSAFQSDLNARLGVGTSARSRGASYSALQERAEDQARAESRRASLVQQLLPEAAELERTKSILSEINDLRARGLVTEQQADTMRAREAVRHSQTLESIKGMTIAQDKYSRGVGLARHELVNLSRQAQDVFVSLTSGQSPLTVLIQQGTQIADVFASSRASPTAVFRQMLGAITPLRAAIGGMAASVLAGAAAWYAYSEGQRAVEVSLIGIGRGSGLAVDGINRIAEQAARLDRMSTASARSIAAGFASTGKIDGSLVAGLTSASYGYGVLSGKPTADAGKDLAAAFADPVRGAEQLNERLGFLSAGLRDYIRNSVAAGDRTSAQKALFDAVNPALAQAAENASALGKAWNYVANAASNAADAIGRALSKNSLQDTLAGVEQQIAKLKSAQSGFWGGQANVSGRLAGLETQRDALRVQIEYDRRKAEQEEREVKANRLGLQANDVVRSILDDVGRLESLRGNKSLLEKVIGDPEALQRVGLSADQVREALARVTTQLGTYKTATERAAEDGRLQVQQIMAYTLQQRAAVEAQRAYTEALRSSGNASLAAVEAENARNRVIAEANRQARDALRDANLDAKLVGLAEGPRALQELRNRQQRERDQFGGAVPSTQSLITPWPSAPAAAGGARGADGIDAAFKAKVSALIEAIGDSGARMTSGFRSFEKQSELYEKYGPGKAARPGSSQHEHGTAMDFTFSSPDARARALEMASRYGLRALPSNGGAVHFDLGSGGRRAPANDNAAVSGDLTSAHRRQMQSLTEEMQFGRIRQAEFALRGQMSTLDDYRRSVGATAQEQAYLNERMRLYADYARAGIEVTPKMAQEIEALAKKSSETAEAFRHLDFAKGQMAEWRSTEQEGVKGFFSDLISDARKGEFSIKSLGNAFSNLISKFADKSVSMLLDRLMFNQQAQGGGSMFGGIFGMIGSLFGGGGPTSLLPSANGNVFGGSGIVPFARGGVFTNSIVSAPTVFPFAKGVGLMGEAGPEAIMPLKRGANGALGVAMHGAAGSSIIYSPTINVSGDTSEASIAALRAELVASERRLLAAQQAGMKALVADEPKRAGRNQARFG